MRAPPLNIGTVELDGVLKIPGWIAVPVGSGVVESACKRIVGSRLKRSGCRWSKAGANALLAVKCCIDNSRWTDFLDWRACRDAAA